MLATPRPVHVLFVLLASIVAGCGNPPAPPTSSAATPTPELPATEALIARAKSLELSTPYEPVPGDALEHHTSGFAKTMCSAVFITGLDPDFAAENVGYFTAPYAERKKVGKPVVDRAKKTVQHHAAQRRRRARRGYTGSQGCVTLPPGQDGAVLHAVAVKPQTCPTRRRRRGRWATCCPQDPLPAGIDEAKLKSAVDAAFEPSGARPPPSSSPGKGRLIGERYGDGITVDHAARELVDGQERDATHDGRPDREGRLHAGPAGADSRVAGAPGDPRAADPHRGHPAHVERHPRSARRRIPTTTRTARIRITSTSTRGGIDSFKYAATRPQQWPPNTVGRYRNTDPVLTNYLIRLGDREARRGLPVVSAARAVRQDRRPHDGDGDRSVRQLPDPGLRVHVGAATGRGLATSTCRTACGTASAFCPRAT